MTRDVARRSGALHAIIAARGLNYIPDHLGLGASDWHWAWWRPLLEAFLGAAVMWTLIVHRGRRRHGAAAIPARV